MTSRLADGVTPTRYALLVEPLPGFEFRCQTTIELQAKQPTNKILLNAKNLQIERAKINANGTEQVAEISLQPEEELVQLRFAKPINGKATLAIVSKGQNTDSMYGFYRSSYEKDGKKEWLLTTHFEPADARALLPCIDEPEAKAVFEVSVLIDERLEAVSNTPPKRVERQADGRKLVVFESTPKMSTYLLYLAVGNFDALESNYGKVKLRVLTVPGKKHLAGLALDYCGKFLRFFENYFNIPYPLPKLDLLAVPDFSAGAMENWGAITFRETALLGDENSSIATKQRIAEVVAHELAHQWFGNLVTMEWWDDLWLNESFATFMAYKAIEFVIPEWRLMQHYLDSRVAAAQAADALLATHPINVEVQSPQQIESIFDNISYDKGGSVLLMLEDFVGDEAFRKGLTRYLRENMWSNASKADLWNAVEAEYKQLGGKEQVSEIVSHWVNEPGYPIVYVTKTTNGFRLVQKRYVMSKDLQTTPWPIPIRYLDSEGQTRSIVMHDNEMELPTKARWIKFNHGQAGFYRVHYDEATLQQLGELSQNGNLSGVDVWGVENDLFALARTGRRPMDNYLQFVERYLMDAGFPTDSSVSGHLRWLLSNSWGLPHAEKARLVTQKFHAHLMEKLGWQKVEGEDANDTLLRNKMIFNLGLCGDTATMKTAGEMFNDLKEKGKDLESNLKTPVYFLAAWSGGLAEFDYFVDRIKSEKNPEEHQKLLLALGHFKDEKLARKALDFAISEHVRPGDTLIIQTGASSNPANKSLSLSWILANWKTLRARYPSGYLLRRMTENASVASDQASLDSMWEFFQNPENMFDSVRRAVAQVLERIEANIAMNKANGRS